MAQLWVNLPRAHKMDAPHYQAITADQVAEVPLPDGVVRIIAGEHAGVKGPAKTYTPINVLDVRLNAGGKVVLPVPVRHNAGVLVMKGEVTLGTERAALHDFVVFANQGEQIALSANTDAQLLVLTGEPIGEPIAQHGPFVMNTAREIEQAFVDFHGGKFGRLDD